MVYGNIVPSDQYCPVVENLFPYNSLKNSQFLPPPSDPLIALTSPAASFRQAKNVSCRREQHFQVHWLGTVKL